MKRSYPTNVDGQIFNIDEDAFLLLQNYLQQLHNTFGGTEGAEIVGDIESRIREHFDEKTRRGTNVIVLADVNRVISIMGKPEEISRDSFESVENPDEQKEAQKNDSNKEEAEKPFITINLPGHRKLFRNMQNKVFGGVFGGISAYLNWNANIMRILYSALTLFIFFELGAPSIFLLILYSILWMIIPPAITPRQILEMRGKPVNVENIGRAVLSTNVATPSEAENSSDGNGFFTSIFRALANFVVAFGGIVSGVACFGGVVCLIYWIMALFSYSFFDNRIYSGMGWDLHGHGVLASWTLIVWNTVEILLTGIISFAAIRFFGKYKPLGNTLKITGIVILAILISIGIALSVTLNSY